MSQRGSRFKVQITEHWVEDQKRKEWLQVYDYRRALKEGERDHAYVEEVVPTEQSRTVLEAEVESLDIDEVVAAVFRLSLVDPRSPGR